MSNTPTTVNNLGVAMFTVTNQDDALGFYTEKLGYEVRSDVNFGEGARWLEVAPPGSTARLALNEPRPGEGLAPASIGVETSDVKAEHERLSEIDGLDVDAEIMEMPGAPSMFMLRDPDGNTVVVVDGVDR